MIYFFLSCRAVDPSIGRRLITFLVRRSKVLLVLLCIGGLHSSIASAIEVGGHLTQDTVWSPENNPYEVTENLYVDSGVTLTILPGTEIKLQGALLTSWPEFDQSFWLPNNQAKMIWVDGRIIAIGTAQDSIKFSKLQNTEDYFWGCIFFSEQADLPVFKFVDIQYSAGIGIELGHTARGSLSLKNGKLSLSNCYFYNNAMSIGVYTEQIETVEILNSTFSYNPANYFVENMWISTHISITSLMADNESALIADNYLYSKRIFGENIYYVNNQNQSSAGLVSGSTDKKVYIYNNEFFDCETALKSFSESNWSLYVKNNSFSGGYDAIDIDDAYLEIRDNYFEGCDVNTNNVTGKYYNNRLNDGYLSLIGDIELINNISSNGNTGFAINQIISNNNNISINNDYAFGGYYNGIYNNCILLGNNEITEYGVSGNPIFRNCILDFDLPEECIDGGGNIIVEPAEVNSIFEDYENGDFHLREGSLAVDAGFDSLGYYYPFDLENNVRVWDGDGDGRAVIDIGAYEYGAPQLGKISGYITETDSGEPVDYVLLKANNEPGEFTFADSSGYFEIQLPEGTYDLYAERVFYEDNIIYTVTVENEQTTELNFNLTYDDPLVGISDNEINMSDNLLKTSNYPNPFNPTTTISFNLPSDSEVLVEVYNLRGQKVKTLVKQKMVAGQNRVVWNGDDSNGSKVSSGIYFYRVKTKHSTVMKKIILLK